MLARKTLKETNDDVYEYYQALCGSTGLQLKLKYLPEQGFNLTFVKLPGQTVPASFFIQGSTKNGLRCSTIELMKFNQRVKESLEEIFLISDRILADLLAHAKESLSELYSLSEIIGELDLLCSAAEYAKNAEAVCPEFGDSIVIKDGRNPILEAKGDASVPNDFYCSALHEVYIISGVNMVLKSRACDHLRQPLEWKDDVSENTCVSGDYGANWVSASVSICLPEHP